MSYNFRKKQIEQSKFGMKTNFGMENSMVVFNFQYFQNITSPLTQGPECPQKASNANNF